MLVERKMKRSPITIGPEESLKYAMELVKEKKVRHLPVLDEGKLVGILSDRDIRQAWASSATTLEIRELYYLLDRLKVKEIMTKKVITVAPETTIEEAARLLHDHKIGCLPVVSQGEFKGIITETDVLEVLVEVMGLNQESSRIEVVLEDRPGTLAEVLGLVKARGVNIASVVTYHLHEAQKGVAVLRVALKDPSELVAEITKAGYKVLSAMPARSS